MQQLQSKIGPIKNKKLLHSVGGRYQLYILQYLDPYIPQTRSISVFHLCLHGKGNLQSNSDNNCIYILEIRTLLFAQTTLSKIGTGEKDSSKHFLIFLKKISDLKHNQYKLFIFLRPHRNTDASR